MKLIRTFLPLAAAAMIAFNVNAQDHELGGFLGAALYQGDLSEAQITFSETKPAFGALYRYYFNPKLNFKANVYFGWVSGDDKNYPTDGRDRRNLNFKSPILDGMVQLEYNILPFISGSERYRIAPYVFIGLGGFYFNPTTIDPTGVRVKLQPLGTEGQNLPGGDGPYSKIQFATSHGIGLKYHLGKLWNLGLEIGQRKTLTDYIDDVSTVYPNLSALPPATAALSDRAAEAGHSPHQEFVKRGNPDKKDTYLFGGITLTKTFRKYSCKDF